MPSTLRLSDLTRNALTLGAGTAAGQALVVLATPIWSRIYSSADFGRLGLLLSFLGAGIVGVALRYDLAITLGRNREEASLLLVLSLLIIGPMSILLGLSLSALCELGWLGYGELPIWSGLLAIPLLAGAGAFTALRYWHVGNGEFSEIGRALVVQGAARAVTPILLGTLPLGWLGLVAGEAAGRFLGIGRLSRDVVPSMRAAIGSDVRSSLRTTARSYRRFPIVFLPSAVLDAVSSAIVLPLFVFLFGVSSGGELLLAQQIIVAPSALMCAALADVYHRRLVQLARERTSSLHAVVIRESGRLILLAALILGPLGLIAPYLASPVFGAGWERVGMLVLVLAPSAVAGVAASTLSRALVVSKVPQLKYIADVLKLTVPTGAMIVAQRSGCGLVGTVAIYSAALALIQVVYLLIIAHAVKPEYQTE